MAPRSRKRARSGYNTLDTDAHSKEGALLSDNSQEMGKPHPLARDPQSAATAEEQKKWAGFCEIESDPAIFQVMLEDFGVKGVAVHEPLALEDEFLELLPKPVYGLIFLFRWRDEGDEAQSSDHLPKIWFANQTVSNACASVALLNIVNNVPGLDLGAPLTQFKEDTKSLNPKLRGDAVGDFDFVRAIHNSFSRSVDRPSMLSANIFLTTYERNATSLLTLANLRKNDMLNQDLEMKNEIEASKNKGRFKASNSELRNAKAAFHFNAFVPIDDQLWKLDGLAERPMRIGAIEAGNWLLMARPDIVRQMNQYEDGEMGFALLALCADPLLNLVGDLAKNIKMINILRKNLKILGSQNRESSKYPTFESSVIIDESLLLGPSEMYHLSEAQYDSIEIDDSTRKLCNSSLELDLITLLEEKITSQLDLRRSILQHLDQRSSDREKCEARRWDHAPFILQWLGKLAQKGALRNLIERYPAVSS